MRILLLSLEGKNSENVASLSVQLFILPMQYHANELLPLKDELLIEKVMSYLSKCIKDLDSATVVDKEIGRFPKRLTHFFPGEHLKSCH